ncbi:MAG: insulinase family protein, partial [Candidatus Kariarchaeaceae archaeon]
MSQNSLIQSRDNLSTISLAVGIPVGAASEYSGGLTQVMTSHMLRNTKHKGEQELARYLDDNGIVPFSAVGKTIMYIGMNCPPQKVQQATDILEEILFQPEFKAETIAKITQQQKGGLQQLEQIAQARLFQRTRWEVAFGKSNITKIPTGTIEDLEKIDTESLE